MTTENKKPEPIKFESEIIFEKKNGNKSNSNTSAASISRRKIIGGWIIKSLTIFRHNKEISSSESMVFVPDANHEWEIEK